MQTAIRDKDGRTQVLLTDADLEREYRLQRQTWRRMRSTGTGPRFIKLGGRVAYRRSDVEAWLAEQTVTSTAENKARKQQTKRANLLSLTMSHTGDRKLLRRAKGTAA